MNSIHSNTLATGLVAAFLIFVNSSTIAGPGRAGPKAPYATSEVAVYATPDQLPDEVVLKYLPYAEISIVATGRGREEKKARELRARGFRAGVNRLVQAFEVPDDPLYSPYQWHLTRIQSDEAWGLTDGASSLVAVLDTGLATAGAEDGIGCVSTDAYDVVNQDNDPDDGDGHGTHVSGTVAEATNNGTGAAGMAHGACVLPVKVLDDRGSGTVADIADGIHYAADKGAPVINMSLGISARFKVTNDPVMDPALDYAYDAGVAVVCAAGNESSRLNVGYPAIYPTTIAVGATDYLDVITSYSNSGLGIDVFAPGGDTRVDLNGDGYPDGVLQETRIDGEWGYYFFQGTSMASPHVAATAALLVANGTATTPDEVYDALTETAMDLGDPGYDILYGHGLVQAADALEWVAGEPSDCTDMDGDGFCAEDDDCDDNDPDTYPGAPDSRRASDRDGIDNDCDGLIDR